MKRFLAFVQEQGVVGIAVAFVLGAAVTKLVASFVTDIVNPVLSVLLGAASGLAGATLRIGRVKILYGDFISALIDFMIVSLVVFVAYEILRLEKLDKKKK